MKVISPRTLAIFMIGFIVPVAATPAARADDLLRCQLAETCEAWRSVYSGPGGNDLGRAIAASPDGARIYVTGESDSLIGDDLVTVAYDAASGIQRWVDRYDGPARGEDGGRSVVVSADGTTVYAAGESPGVGTLQDFAVVAIDAVTGARRWIARYDGPTHGDDFARKVVVTPDGARVMVTGYSEGGVPGKSDYDYATIALDAASGTRLWEARYDTGWRDVSRGIALSPDGSRAYVTGYTGQGSSVQPDVTTTAYDTATGATL